MKRRRWRLNPKPEPVIIGDDKLYRWNDIKGDVYLPGWLVKRLQEEGKKQHKELP